MSVQSISFPLQFLQLFFFFSIKVQSCARNWAWRCRRQGTDHIHAHMWKLFARDEFSPEEWWRETAVSSQPLWSGCSFWNWNKLAEGMYRTAVGEFNTEHCGPSRIMTAWYQSRKKWRESPLRNCISQYILRHPKCKQTFGILIIVKLSEGGI